MTDRQIRRAAERKANKAARKQQPQQPTAAEAPTSPEPTLPQSRILNPPSPKPNSLPTEPTLNIQPVPPVKPDANDPPKTA